MSAADTPIVEATEASKWFGEVVAVNTQLDTHPEAVNSTPHETWMIRLKPSAPDEAASLLDASAYGALVQ